MLQHRNSSQEADASASSRQTKLNLPSAPKTELEEVKAWSEPVEFLTYMPAEPDKNPLFLEKRVYQGSSGRVYPLPVIDSIATDPETRTWEAVHIENEFIRLMVMPEIGGRIHVGLDKRTGYDFFYRQNVIKPALVGLTGPWISGGVEFNWPQHHRPATFMPVETTIERSPDGSVTVWCSDYDPMARMKGMHGICLHPGKAFVEVRVRLYNRTLDTQTFLWWANVATRVHEKYQSFFPHDVRFAADHAKRAVTEYPLSRGSYYGVDYGERSRTGVPAGDLPSQFVPDGSYPPNDLGWFANIPVPTSYMIAGSREDFFGGYDHKAEAGTVAFADHHISPGKKQWTWGNHEFGYAWDRNLTEEDGPYVELMSGVYTDNQPDFSFLSPGETKTFSQFWYPIGSIGAPDIANLDGALRLQVDSDGVYVHVQVTSDRPNATVCLKLNGDLLCQWTQDLSVREPAKFYIAADARDGTLEATVSQESNIFLRYAPAEIEPAPAPEVATEPPLPQDITSNDELYLTGLHLEQYRHATRAPDIYWAEALRRDPGDSRANHALGRFFMRRGEFMLAEEYLRASIKRSTKRNPNPSDGEPHYNLGLTLLLQGRQVEAYDAFYKCTWNAAWRGPGYHRLAEIDCCRQEWHKALDHLDRSLVAEAENLNVLNLKAIVLARLERGAEATGLLARIGNLDPLDAVSSFLETRRAPEDGQQQLDLAFDFARAGLFQEALDALSTAPSSRYDGSATLGLYAKADILYRMNRTEEAAAAQEKASSAKPDYVFPSRLEEMLLLQRTIHRRPDDARAHYYLGNLLYDRRRYEEAIEHWKTAASLEPHFATTWRNLAFALFNVHHDANAAATAFTRAREISPEDARLLYEQDQLLKRIGTLPEERLRSLEAQMSLLKQRDDLSLEYASLLNSTGQPQEALDVLLGRQFGPWEGGEGQVLGQYVRALVLLAKQNLKSGQTEQALTLLNEAERPPRNLSEAKHLLMSLNMVDYWKGKAYSALGQGEQAQRFWERAANRRGDFQGMQVQAISETSYWSALALRALGRTVESQELLHSIEAYASALEKELPKIDYFATSLPTMLLFNEDLQDRQNITALFLRAQAQLGLGNAAEAKRLLQEVQARDRNHTGAIDLLSAAMAESE